MTPAEPPRPRPDSDWLAGAFEEHREHLRAVAYRLLGSMSDADDAVQDTWLRLTSADASEVENLGGWLTTVVARVSLLVVLDALTPAERLAFVLHDMFAMPFTEVADVLGRTPEATRQLASRARRRVRGAPSPDQAADVARQREVAAAFLAASRGGDLSALVALLDSDVTLSADAAAVPSGRAAVLHGAEMVATGAIAAAARAEESRLALVDGAVGIVYAPGGHLRIVLALTVGETGQITAIDVIADPDRLRRLHLAVLPD